MKEKGKVKEKENFLNLTRRDVEEYFASKEFKDAKKQEERKLPKKDDRTK